MARLENGQLSVESDGITGFGVFFLPVGPVDVFAKGGVISFDTDIKFAKASAHSSATTAPISLTASACNSVCSASACAPKYEMFDIDNVNDANMLSIGVTYTFL